MLRVPSLRGATRLALILALAGSYVTWHTHEALAKGHDDSGDDSGDDGGDDGGDDSGDSGGDDSGGGDSGGGDDGGDDSGGDDDGGSADTDQPSVTAGGLYTINTYPVRENDRPLTMTQHITQVRLGLGTDISAKGAFGTGGLNLEGVYGLKDNFTLMGGLTDAYNFKQYGVYFGFEGALAYDLLDIRVTAEMHRSAIPEYQNFCSPVATGDPTNPQDPATCKAMGASLVNLPDGNYSAGNSQFSINLGFPLRYAFKPQIAIVALQTLIKFDFNGVARDHVVPSASMDAAGNTITKFVPAPNSAKPDLVPSLGVAVNPIPQLSLVVYGQLRIPDFDTSAGAFQIPVTARIEGSPTQKLDFGLEFTLLNVKPPDPQSPIDNRFLSLFMQARY